MMRAFAHISFVTLLSGAAVGQSTPPKPAFQIADVHVSPHARNPNVQGGALRAGRYELRQPLVPGEHVSVASDLCRST
jgi:hypothetical protein